MIYVLTVQLKTKSVMWKYLAEKVSFEWSWWKVYNKRKWKQTNGKEKKKERMKDDLIYLNVYLIFHIFFYPFKP